nr:efflux RND transporter permease subunit [Lignipirellula cremea]
MQRQPIVLTLVGMLMVWGVYSVVTMPRREDPEFTIRTCAVSTQWPGAPAEKVEELITKPLEEAIDSIEEVKEVYSTTINGLSTIYVDAEDTVSPDRIDNVWDKVRARVQLVKMPASNLEPRVNDEFGDTAVILFAVHQKPMPDVGKISDEHRYSYRQLDQISERIKDELRLIDGVAKSEQYGVREEAIYVETDAATWSQLSLTSDSLQQLLASRNIVAAGGLIDTPDGRYTLTPGGDLNAVNEINSLITGFAENNGKRRPVYLKDMGMEVVRDYEDPPRLICRYGDAEASETAVIVALTMKSGANIIDICEQAKRRVVELQEIEQAVPPDIAIDLVSDQSANVGAKIADVMNNVIGAIVIVVIVVYLIVGLRSALVMAANIPVVVLGSIAMVTLFDVQLEQISLASIIIALGLLVDNAVQVCDQARANQILGMSPEEAAVTGSNQVASPMLMGTATTIAAFAPMLFALVGSKKEYVYSLPVTLSVTLAVSWLLAMTFCTILAARFIRAPQDPNQPDAPLPWLMARFRLWLQHRRQPAAAAEGENASANAAAPGSPPPDRLMSLFRGVVRMAIDFKFVTLGVSVLLLIGVLFLPIGSEFFPKDMRDQFVIDVWLPESASLLEADAAAAQVEGILRALSPTDDPIAPGGERVRAIRTMVGGGGSRWYLSRSPESPKPFYAEVLVRTTDAAFTPELARRVREIAERGDKQLGLEPVTSARVVPQELFLGPSSPPVEIRVFGPGLADKNTLRGFAERVKALIRNQPGVWDVNDSWGVAGHQLFIDVDEDKANLAGVTNASIAQTLNAYFSGHYLTTFREGDHLAPVYLRLRREERDSLAGIETAFVEGQYGKTPFDAVASIDRKWLPAQIRRRDLNRVIEVRSQVEEGVRGNDIVKAIMGSAEMAQLQQDLPPGFRIEVGGSLKDSNEAAGQLGTSLGVSVLLIVTLLVIQYNGWSKPTIILATLPLALVGALPGLWLTGNPLGFMPQLGILSLFGIVLNTGIIFMEFADILLAERAAKSDGKGPISGLTIDEFRTTLVDAANQRLLPIFLTTATTVGGLIPLALGGGPLWEGMAWCMITGLCVATVLTLLVVPALYAIFVETLHVKPVPGPNP